MTGAIGPQPTVPQPTVLHSRPGYEGANIRTWIGFKHFMYLAERAVLQWLSDRGTGPGALYLEHGLGAEITDFSVQLPAVLEIDDEVRAEVTGAGPRLNVRLSVTRHGTPVTVLSGKVKLALVRERTAGLHRPAPEPLAALEAADLAAASTVTGPPAIAVPPGASPESVLAGSVPAGSVPAAGPAGFVWSWRAPYFYCHFSDRVQHSGFVRALEEVVDRFLADRGISVGRMLTERSWIPVVSRARVQLIGPAYMEETIHTVFTVTGILRGVMFDGRMDCYAERDGELVPVATATILHGYAIAAGEGAGGMASLDPGVIAALTGSKPAASEIAAGAMAGSGR
jgi:acyl-CoA thioesterase FadM